MKIPYQKQHNIFKGTWYSDIFCKKCLTHERHFKGGHSWTPDICPCGCEETVGWEDLSFVDRQLAKLIEGVKYGKKEEEFLKGEEEFLKEEEFNI